MFQVLKILKIWVYSGFNENLLKQLKTRIRKNKINKLFVNDEHVLHQVNHILTYHTAWIYIKRSGV